MGAKAIEKEEKLAWVAKELNNYVKNLKASKEKDRRALVESDEIRHELKNTKHELEEIKHEFWKKCDMCASKKW